MPLSEARTGDEKARADVTPAGWCIPLRHPHGNLQDVDGKSKMESSFSSS
jgi:hypothetical protein